MNLRAFFFPRSRAREGPETPATAGAAGASLTGARPADTKGAPSTGTPAASDALHGTPDVAASAVSSANRPGSRAQPKSGGRQRTGLLRGWVTRWLGDAGERAAARYLKAQGFRILARQYRTSLGEIDLIAQDGQCVVFVEVKTRRSSDAGLPVEAVGPAKQAQLTRLALAYLRSQRLLDHAARFDVVAVLWSEGDQPPQIVHYRNAFPPVGRGQMFS